MNTKLLVSIKNLLLLVLVSCILLANSNEAFAKGKKGKKKGKSKKHRVYNPSKTRELAIATIVNNSQAVSEIAGLEPNDEAINNANNKESIFRKDQEEAEDFELPNQPTIDPETGELIGDMGEDLSDLQAYDDIQVDENRIMSLWSQFLDDDDEEVPLEKVPTDQTGNLNFASIKKSEMMKKIMNWFGTPYRMGGMGKKAIDCSAFTQAIFYQTANVLIPRTAREQIQVGKSIQKSKLQFGDLIFFHTYSKRFASHVGIYLGDNLFAHASSRFGVTVSSLESTFYTRAYCGARRLRESDMKNLALKVTANKVAKEDSEEDGNY